MTRTDNLTNQPIHPAAMGTRMLQGAAIALALISFFLISAGEPNPDWGTYWMVKPLIMVPLAGAAGGVFYYFMDHLRHEGGWKKALGIALSIVGYLFAVWIGTVLGLNGTMWD